MGSISILTIFLLAFTAVLPWYNIENNNLITDDTGIVYEINSSTNECAVVSYSGNSRKVVIPDKYQEYAVTSISDDAFAFCKLVYQVAIPETVIEFGSGIFTGCNINRLTIVAQSGSEAEKYAIKNKFLVTDTTKTVLSVKSIKDIENYQEKIYVYNSPSKVRWESLDETVAKVNAYGKVTITGLGKTIIIAKTTKKTLKCKVKVLRRNKKNCLKIIASKYITEEMSDYEKIYAAHAWIIQNVKYDKRLYTKGRVPSDSHYAEGAFNKGIAVCDGYAKAFMAIMKYYNIPCIMVTGGYHAWNIVKIKNKWYHIDCTFDDPVVNGKFNNKKIYMDFFLKTDKDMYATHKWDYTVFPKCVSTKPNKKYRTI